MRSTKQDDEARVASLLRRTRVVVQRESQHAARERYEDRRDNDLGEADKRSSISDVKEPAVELHKLA